MRERYRSSDSLRDTSASSEAIVADLVLLYLNHLFTNYVTDNGAALETADDSSCGIWGLSGFQAYGTNSRLID